MVTETRTLIRAINKMHPAIQFFKNRYFPDGRVYYSQEALIETKRKGKEIAPFVIPVVGGIVMESEGYRARRVKAPYIAPKMPITPEDIEQKAFGESPESGRTPEQRENEVEAEHLDDLRTSILRRMEQMCTSIVMSGRVEMKHYASAEDAANDRNPQVMLLQFYEQAFENRYKLSKPFHAMSIKEKIMELYKMASILKKRGFKATDLVMTSDVAMEFMTDEDFLKFYDKAKVNIGNIDPKEIPDGVVYNGGININGVVMSMFTYEESYKDLDGEEKDFLPKGTIAFLHPNMGETVYSQVTFVKDKKLKTFAAKIVPRIVADEKSNVIEVQTFSRPVPYPFHWDSWLVTNIYDSEEGEQDIQTMSESDTFPGGTQEELNNGEITLKSESEIKALNKTPLIEYGLYIGMTNEQVNDQMTVVQLREAILNFQEETYPEEDE